MTQFTLVKHQSLSKFGTIAGLGLGYFLGRSNRFVADSLGIIGTIAGSFISAPATNAKIDNSADIKQIALLKDHFSKSGLEELNPIHTNYSLYERDCIGDCFSWLKSIKNKIMSKFVTIDECIHYRNKMISEKYIVFDTFHNTDLKSLILDIAPLGIVAGVNILNKKSALGTIADVAIIYGSKPIINYALYIQDNLHDYETLTLQFNKHEIGLFEDVLPPELAAEVIRVAAE